jgi:hypothetical protein
LQIVQKCDSNERSAWVPKDVHPHQDWRQVYYALNDSWVRSASIKHLLKGSTVSLTREEWIILILGTPDTEPMEIGAVLPDDCGSGGETLASRIEVVGFAQ